MMAREIFPRPEDGRIHLEPVDAGREQKFREEALERLFVGRTLDARLVAAEVESDQSSELDFGVRLAEARVGERILAFRDALRIETHYGLAPKTLYSGLTQEELGDLSDDERVGMFSLQAQGRPTKKKARGGRVIRSSARLKVSPETLSEVVGDTVWIEEENGNYYYVARQKVKHKNLLRLLRGELP